MHAVVAQSTFPSQNAQNTPTSDNFREVEMSKKCTPLWREAHFQVKMLKNDMFKPLLNVQVCSAWQAQGIVHLVKSE